uniref:Uncharacterized protein n=1 Tax=Emiliania huxleyi TaxID=2903 RepID=A0A7S3W4S6_EMIHU|mmetsp:Transcript_9287/g.27688  ORF Transcript_9287/g.27688 Transcript_9287/m.27688 type:complete len:146 (-) Transcript_9287:40-477(-)
MAGRAFLQARVAEWDALSELLHENEQLRRAVDGGLAAAGGGVGASADAAAAGASGVGHCVRLRAGAAVRLRSCMDAWKVFTLRSRWRRHAAQAGRLALLIDRRTRRSLGELRRTWHLSLPHNREQLREHRKSSSIDGGSVTVSSV